MQIEFKDSCTCITDYIWIIFIIAAHSMEEAEHLCDRLGIFVDGSLQCIGNPKEVSWSMVNAVRFSKEKKPKCSVAVICEKGLIVYVWCNI